MELKELSIIVAIVVSILTFVMNVLVYNFFYKPDLDKKLISLQADFDQSTYVTQKRWELRREACLNALDIADALISSGKYENYSGPITKQSTTTKDIRKCCNLLAATCEKPDVLKTLQKIIKGNFSPDIIVDLRNAVRLELNFDKKQIDTDRDSAFVAKSIFD